MLGKMSSICQVQYLMFFLAYWKSIFPSEKNTNFARQQFLRFFLAYQFIWFILLTRGDAGKNVYHLPGTIFDDFSWHINLYVHFFHPRADAIKNVYH